MALGDNLLYGNGLGEVLHSARTNAESNGRSTIFGYYVANPEQYGVVEFTENGRVVSIDEKPCEPKSNYAVIGLYFYPKGVAQKSESIVPHCETNLK